MSEEMTIEWWLRRTESDISGSFLASGASILAALRDYETYKQKFDKQQREQPKDNLLAIMPDKVEPNILDYGLPVGNIDCQSRAVDARCNYGEGQRQICTMIEVCRPAVEAMAREIRKEKDD